MTENRKTFPLSPTTWPIFCLMGVYSAQDERDTFVRVYTRRALPLCEALAAHTAFVECGFTTLPEPIIEEARERHIRIE